MSDDITNLMQQVYDYFLNLYHQAQTFEVESQNTFLTFEPVGTPITPGMFKLHSADPTYYQPLAVEVFSTLANDVPAINTDVLQPTGKTVDDFYTMLLSGSQSDPQSSSNALFLALKSQALKKLDETALVSLQGPFKFLPAFATPPDWYDSTIEANWTPYSFSTGTPPPPPPAGPRPPQNYIPLQRRIWEWRVPSAEAPPVVIHPALLEQLSLAEPAPEISNRLKLALSFDTAPEEQMAGEAASLGMGMEAMSMRQFSPIASNVASPTADVAMMPAKRFSPIDTMPADTSISATEATRLQPLPDNPAIADDAGVVAVNRPILMRAKMTQIVDSGQSEPVQSHSLKLSLNYCLVRINRPWFSQAFLTTQDWYLPGFAAGGLAQGTATSSNDPFPAVLVACLAVKDLQITTDWSEISGVAQQSAAFGPFSLIGQTTNQTTSTLSVPGIQIIGWICQIMPTLPPATAPGVTAPPDPTTLPAAGDTPTDGTAPPAPGASSPASPTDGSGSANATTPPTDGTALPAPESTPPAAPTPSTAAISDTAPTTPSSDATPSDGTVPTTQTTN